MKKIKNKKNYLFSIGAIAAIALPIAAVVSCGSESNTESASKNAVDLNSKLEAVQKSETKAEYAEALRKLFEGKYDKADASQSEVSTATILDTNDFATNKAAAEALITAGVYGKFMAAANTVVTVNGVEKDLGKFTTNLTVSPKTAGTAAVEAVNTVLTINGKDLHLNQFLENVPAKATVKTAGHKAEKMTVKVEGMGKVSIDAAITAAKDVQTILDELGKYKGDAQGAAVNTDSVTSVVAPKTKLDGQKMAAKALTTGLFSGTYTPATNTVVTIGTEDVDLGGFVTDTTLTVKTAGSAEVKLTAAVKDDVDKAIDAAADEAAILAELGKYKTDEMGQTAVDVSTVTAAGTLAEKKAAAKALTTNLFSGTHTDEVKTVVTIDGKDYTLKSFVASPKVVVKTAGSAEVKLTAAVKTDVDKAIDAAADEAAILAELAKYKTDEMGQTAVDVSTVKAVAEPKSLLKLQKEAAMKIPLFREKDMPAEATVVTIDGVEDQEFNLGTFVEESKLAITTKEAGSAAVAATNTVVTVDGVDVDLGKFVSTPESVATVTTKGNAETPGTKETVSVPEAKTVSLADYKKALKEILAKYKDKDGKALVTTTIDVTKTHEEALKAAEKIKAYSESK
ncbi:MAG: hypothetical protein HRT99_01200 [Mycoplasmatales bacterium]|nr:hypothetical protein [Mycoplasmatales bacterium]